MYVITVQFDLVPEDADKFLDMVVLNAKTSRLVEPGCLQFDVCRDPSKPTTVFLYEVYESSDAFEAHLSSDHFLRFDAEVALMVKTKTVRRYREVWQ